MPVALLAAGSIAPAGAAHPLLTEDTGTQGLGNAQLELMVDSVRDRPQGVSVREQVTTAILSYGVRDNVDLQLGVPHLRQHTHDAAGRHASEGALDASASSAYPVSLLRLPRSSMYIPWPREERQAARWGQC